MGLNQRRSVSFERSFGCHSNQVVDTRIALSLIPEHVADRDEISKLDGIQLKYSKR